LENAGEELDKVSGKPYCAITNQHLAVSAKRTGTQRGAKVTGSVKN